MQAVMQILTLQRYYMMLGGPQATGETVCCSYCKSVNTTWNKISVSRQDRVNLKNLRGAPIRQFDMQPTKRLRKPSKHLWMRPRSSIHYEHMANHDKSCSKAQHSLQTWQKYIKSYQVAKLQTRFSTNSKIQKTPSFECWNESITWTSIESILHSD